LQVIEIRKRWSLDKVEANEREFKISKSNSCSGEIPIWGTSK
jgi:hypothetical protein